MLIIRYFAAARAAAGTTEEKLAAQAGPATPSRATAGPATAGAATLRSVLAELATAHPERLAAILPACSFLVDGITWHDCDAALPSDATIDVLPPFAGG